jgi:glycosyltransferase involved in cell wall biosynthesis
MKKSDNQLGTCQDLVSYEDTQIHNIAIRCYQRTSYKISHLLQMIRYGHCSRASIIAGKSDYILHDIGFTAKNIKKLALLRQLKTNTSTCRCIGLIAHASGDNIFGGERSFLDMARAIYACNFRLVVFLPSGRNKELINELSLYAEAVYTFAYFQDRHTGNLESLEKIFLSIAYSERIDSFYINTITLTNIAGRLKQRGIPVITHARETPMTDQYLCDAFNSTGGEMIHKASSTSNLLICNSKFTASQFQACCKNIVIIPNTVSRQNLDAIAKQRSSNGHTQPIPLRISIISSNIPKKGLSDFIYIARKCEAEGLPYLFQIFGPQNDYIKALAAENKLTCLDIRGYVKDPADALAETDILMSLSHFSESFGRTVLEAISAGIPVIAYANGAIPELIVNGKNGYLIEYKQPNRIIPILKEISKDLSLLKEMALNAYTSSIEYTFTSYCKQIRDAILSVKQKNYLYRPNSKDALFARKNKNKYVEISKLKIAYFLWHFPVPSETFVLNELEEICSRGVQVVVFCKNSPYKDFKPSFDIEVIRVADHEELALKLNELNINIVHSHFAYPTVTEMVWPACEKAHVQFTFIAHAQDIFKYENIDRNKIDEISRSIYCRKIFAPSSFHKSFMIEQGVLPEKISKLANTIKVDSYESDEVSANDDYIIVAINRFVEKKGIEPLIRSAKLLPENFFVEIYGYGELEDTYRSIIESEGIINVKLAGSLSGRDELAKVLARCDLFVAPSTRATNGDMDGIPTILMEALAAKSIVLTTAVSGIPDVIKAGFNGFYCDCTPSSIAEAILSASRLPANVIDSVKTSGYITVKQSYNVRRSVSKMLRIWQQQEIDICIVAWNNIVETPMVIEHIHKLTDSPYHLIICDNASNPIPRLHLTVLYLKYSSNTTLILGHDNAYVGPGTNKCLEAGSAPVAFYVCGKEGFIFEHGWEDQMIEEITRDDQKTGLAGTLCYSPSYFYAKDYKKIDLFPVFRGKEYIDANPDAEMSHIQGGFFAISRDMYNQIGGFSNSVAHNYTDVEYSLYAQSRGWMFSRVNEIVALFNKTKPGIYSRIDSRTKALHPPKIQDIRPIQSLLAGSKVICNLCETIQDPPDSGAFKCDKCRSSADDRAIFKVLVDSKYLYRRLPALLIGAKKEPLATHLKTHFQGRLLSVNDYCDLTANDGLDNPSDRFELILLRLEVGETIHEPGLKEIARVAKPGGLVLIWDLNARIAQSLKSYTDTQWSTQEQIQSDYVYRPSTLPITLMSKAK